MATVHLVDASPYIFRAYFSIPTSMKNPQGAPVNAVYGYSDFLLKLFDAESVTHIAVCFDESLNTCFRNDLYPEYKAQRELPPPELEAQLHWCQQVTQAFGAQTFADLRFEADDFIATLATQLEEQGHDCVIVSSDKDLAQLVSQQTQMLNFAKNERHTLESVPEKFGVPPKQFPDFQGLTGDAVDNIPGVRGVGPKTAQALFEHFDSLESIYANLEQVATLPVRGAKSLVKKLTEQKEQAFLSRQLARLSTEAPAKANLDQLLLQGADPARIAPLFEELGFGRIQKRITRWKKCTQPG